MSPRQVPAAPPPAAPRLAFSARCPASLAEGPLQVARRAAEGRTVDLMLSNPTACGLRYPELAVPLLGHAVPPYRADAAGDLSAREAVAAAMQAAGDRADAAQLVLTASTSAGYAYALKLLCDAGDAVAVPVPSYPLVAHLAELESVRCLPYAVTRADGRWRLDLDQVAAHLAAGARAVVVVSPHSPTGAALDAEQGAALAALCRAAGAAIVLDQVFVPYAGAGAARPLAMLAAAPLVVLLDGLSKSAGMPHLKLGWMLLAGDPTEVAAARERLLFIADTYLSVGQPVQAALAPLLAAAPGIRAQIAARLTANRAALRAALAAAAPAVDDVAVGGWYAVLRLPQYLDEDDTVRALLAAGYSVHPGYYYDFARPGFLVVGLLQPPAVHAAASAAVARVLAALTA